MEISGPLTAWATVAGVLVNIVAVLLVLQQVRLLRRQVKDGREDVLNENDRLKKQATFDFLARTTAEVRQLYSAVPPSGSSLESIKAFLHRVEDRTSEEFFALRGYLNLLENLLAGVNMNVFDEEVIKRTSGSRIRRAWNDYETWIRNERRTTDHENLWKELEEQAIKLQKTPRTRPVGP
jgi:Domain of unknown function (DUF4760)